MKNLAYTIIVIAGVVLFLVLGKVLLIPLVLAIFIWFIIMGLQKKIESVPFIKKNIPHVVTKIFTSIVVLGTLTLFGKMLAYNINRIVENTPIYAENLNKLAENLSPEMMSYIGEIKDYYSEDENFSETVTNLANAVSNVLGNTLLILIYLIFLLLEQQSFKRKLIQIGQNKENPDDFISIVKSLKTTVSEYINLKIIISAMTGFGAYLVFLWVGLDAPVFWSVIIFVLNFIPNIGSLVGTLFPAAFALLQFGSHVQMLQILIPVGLVQVIVGNIVEPKMMGNSLNISALVVILSLSLWGLIWGLTGMLLSVPLTIIATKIMSQFPSTRPIAILLGNGK